MIFSQITGAMKQYHFYGIFRKIDQISPPAQSQLRAVLCITLGLYPAKAGAPRSSARGSAKSCIWGGTMPGTSTCGGLPGWKAARER